MSSKESEEIFPGVGGITDSSNNFLTTSGQVSLSSFHDGSSFNSSASDNDDENDGLEQDSTTTGEEEKENQSHQSTSRSRLSLLDKGNVTALLSSAEELLASSVPKKLFISSDVAKKTVQIFDRVPIGLDTFPALINENTNEQNNNTRRAAAKIFHCESVFDLQRFIQQISDVVRSSACSPYLVQVLGVFIQQQQQAQSHDPQEEVGQKQQQEQGENNITTTSISSTSSALLMEVAETATSSSSSSTHPIATASDLRIVLLTEMPNGTLRRWLGEFVPSTSMLLKYALQLSAAIASLHAAQPQRILYLDLSPNTILVFDKGETLKLDLITSSQSLTTTQPVNNKEEEDEEEQSSPVEYKYDSFFTPIFSPSSRFTTPETSSSSSSSSSPSSLLSYRFSAQDDVYSLAVVMTMLITGTQQLTSLVDIPPSQWDSREIAIKMTEQARERMIGRLEKLQRANKREKKEQEQKIQETSSSSATSTSSSSFCPDFLIDCFKLCLSPDVRDRPRDGSEVLARLLQGALIDDYTFANYKELLFIYTCSLGLVDRLQEQEFLLLGSSPGQNQLRFQVLGQLTSHLASSSSSSSAVSSSSFSTTSTANSFKQQQNSSQQQQEEEQTSTQHLRGRLTKSLSHYSVSELLELLEKENVNGKIRNFIRDEEFSGLEFAEPSFIEEAFDDGDEEMQKRGIRSISVKALRRLHSELLEENKVIIITEKKNNGEGSESNNNNNEKIEQKKGENKGKETPNSSSESEEEEDEDDEEDILELLAGSGSGVILGGASDNRSSTRQDVQHHHHPNNSNSYNSANRSIVILNSGDEEEEQQQQHYDNKIKERQISAVEGNSSPAVEFEAYLEPEAAAKLGVELEGDATRKRSHDNNNNNNNNNRQQHNQMQLQHQQYHRYHHIVLFSDLREKLAQIFDPNEIVDPTRLSVFEKAFLGKGAQGEVRAGILKLVAKKNNNNATCAASSSSEQPVAVKIFFDAESGIREAQIHSFLYNNGAYVVPFHGVLLRQTSLPPELKDAQFDGVLALREKENRTQLEMLTTLGNPLDKVIRKKLFCIDVIAHHEKKNSSATSAASSSSSSSSSSTVVRYEYKYKRRPTCEEILLFTFGFTEAIASMHNLKPRPAVHSDIKPANSCVIVDERSNNETSNNCTSELMKNQRIVLLDTGFSKLRRDRSVASMNNNNNSDTLSLGRGTPFFSPSLMYNEDKKVNARCDVYMLAVSLFQIVTGMIDLSDLAEKQLDWKVARQKEKIQVTEQARVRMIEVVDQLAEERAPATPRFIIDAIKLCFNEKEELRPRNAVLFLFHLLSEAVRDDEVTRDHKGILLDLAKRWLGFYPRDNNENEEQNNLSWRSEIEKLAKEKGEQMFGKKKF